MAKKRIYKANVITAFKITEKGSIVSYEVGDTYSNKNKASIDYLKQIKKLK